VLPCVLVASAVVNSHRPVTWGWDLSQVLAGCGCARSRHLLPREGTFPSKEELDLVMDGTAEHLWFG
jgi:hypothetical protein